MHKVKKGDSFYTIAKRYHVNIDDLKNANAAAVKGLKPGDKIIVPADNKESHEELTSFESVTDSAARRKTATVKNTPDKTAEHSKTFPKDPYHIVKKGDTLSSISHRYSVSVNDLRELNDLKKSAKLKNGQKILLTSEGPKFYTVKKGDNVWSIAKKFRIDAEELMEINDMDSPSLKIGQKLYLEDIQPAAAELQENEVLAKKLEEELKKASEAGEVSTQSFPEKLTLFAKKLLNIPYKFGGNSILGIDCSAYVKKVYGLLGIDLPRTAREQFDEGEPIDREELSVGDLVFFRTYASFPSHVGIYLGNNLFIHASSKGKKVKVDNLDTPYFVKRFIGAKRLLNNENKSTDPKS
ncbi:MAG: LysM peptidoglycan-binding domain-containing protein [Nitrospirota bacterium]|nr:LysM peptidoglycan-binding domain-containing protein [Nitrospirota bacterium]